MNCPLLLPLIALAGLGAVASAHAPREAGIASAWEIGPVIRGRNYSQGAALAPSVGKDGNWYIDLPRAPGSVHYVTFRHGALAGKKRIVMRYRIDLARGAEIRPITAPQLPSILTLYFQRGGDTWSGRGAFETYRWYGTFASHSPIVAGEHTMVAPLDANWTAVGSSNARSNARGFTAALVGADRVGFVLGGGDGYGHGVFATGSARLTVLDFRVE